MREADLSPERQPVGSAASRARRTRSFHPSERTQIHLAARSVTASALLLPILWSSGAGAQVTPDGPQFQVNDASTVGVSPEIGMTGGGSFVVVWEGDSPGGWDGDAIQGRAFDAFGVPIGPQFEINSYTTGFQTDPAVAIDGAGNFVVAWESDRSYTDHDWSIQAQRFAADGTPLGLQFQVSTAGLFWQLFPAVAADGHGNFLVTWKSSADVPNDGIRAQRFDSNGGTLGSQFRVNSYTTGFVTAPTVAATPDGGFVVAWNSIGSNGDDTSGYSIQARRFDSAGAPLGEDFQVNTYTTGDQLRPKVAIDPEGEFVVVWTSGDFYGGGPDGSRTSVQARRYDASGNPLGDEFVVNSYTTDLQRDSGVAMGGSGNLVVTWESQGSDGTDTDESSIQAQTFESTGGSFGDQFQVNTYTTRAQVMPRVASDAEGNFVVVWMSYGSSSTPFASIQGQRYLSAFFYDGFETGDTSRWSASVP